MKTRKLMLIIKGINSRSIPDNLDFKKETSGWTRWHLFNPRRDLNSGSRGSFRLARFTYQVGDQVEVIQGYIVNTLTQKQKLKMKAPVII